jgi:hypothetical protein
MTPEDVPVVVAQLLGRPARWAPEQTLLGDFDSKERTLQVFNAELVDQVRLLEQLEHYRDWLERIAGGPIVVMFFSTRQSLRHAAFVNSFERNPPLHRVQEHVMAPAAADCVDIDSDSGPHRRVA